MKTHLESKGDTLKVRWVGAPCLLVLILLTFWGVLGVCLNRTEGHFTYALDDPYIHLAIAKNLAQHGNWGVTQFGPSSASSSPLWTSLIAVVIRVGGNSVLWPLLLGLVASAAATLVVYFRLSKEGLPVAASLIGSLLVFAVGPLFVLPFTGMEHSLQILLDLLFGFWLIDVLGRRADRRDFWLGLALTAMMCLCRYESVFLVIVPIMVGLTRRDLRLTAGLTLGPVVGFGGFGVYSRLAGMPWVPNSILIKGHLPHSSASSYLLGLGNHILLTLWDRAPLLGFLMLTASAVALALQYLPDKRSTLPLRIWLWTVIAAAVLHAGFAMMGFLFRYEGYLLACLTTGILIAAQHMLSEQVNAKFRPSGYVAFAISAVVIITLLRAMKATHDIPRASSDIHLQQIQMSRFIQRYYRYGRIAANDIGAVSYFSKIHLLDLVGLATDRIREARVNSTFSTAVITREIDAFQPDIILAYPDWFKGSISLPRSLIPVGEWTIPPVTSAASEVVRFYATSRTSAVKIRRQLIEFQSLLPTAVKVTYLGSL